jgi:hypothetical protein
MSKPTILSLLGGAAMSWPVGARGQQRTKVARLGVLLFSTPQFAALRRRIRVRPRMAMSAGYIPFHPNPSKPKYKPPPGAVDTHVFGPEANFP